MVSANQASELQLTGRLLVVDDDHAVADMIVDFFGDQGLDVVAAHDGGQALRLAQDIPPDVVLLDITMPDMSGVQVLQQLRLRWPDLRVIMVSGISDEDLARGTLQRGAFDYIAKPFQWDRLQECVVAALSHG